MAPWYAEPVKVREVDPAGYGGLDPRKTPSYRIAEAAHYLRMPKATLRAWVMGQDRFRAVVELPEPEGLPLLSFVNLVEVHVLDALRRRHRVSLQKVRSALHFLHRHFPDSRHPLAEHDLLTDGLDLFVDRYGSLINASRDGQLAIRKVLEAHLRRVERNPAGAAIRLFPFTRRRLDPDEPRLVVIDPQVSFGRPAIAGIPTTVIAERWHAGESVEELAEDYDRPPSEIEEAIRCEFRPAA